MLAIGDGKLGWTLTKLARSKYVEQVQMQIVIIRIIFVSLRRLEDWDFPVHTARGV